jgi:predicted GNAT family acetyltransferase
MIVQHKQREQRGMFYVQVDGEILARMTYVQSDPGTMIIEHTEVDEELRHENVGYQMVHTAVQYARNHQQKIVPQCPFVKAVFDKKPEYKDVLQETF